LVESPLAAVVVVETVPPLVGISELGARMPIEALAGAARR
jgi:hypothetical protein